MTLPALDELETDSTESGESDKEKERSRITIRHHTINM